MTTVPLRLALYSHDAKGLGHLRRNLALAHHLARALPGLTGRDVTGLVITDDGACADQVEALRRAGVQVQLV